MKKLTIILIIIVVAIFGVFMINKDSNKTEIITTNNPKESINSSSVTTTNTTTTEDSVTNKKFTIDQVATHNTEADCYSAINGLVYDLTAWIKKHPGGNKAILSICGKDGSSAFNEQHKRDPKALSTLEGFDIGVLIP